MLKRNEIGQFLKGSSRGGKFTTKDGYIYIYSPTHPNKVKGTYVLAHRLIMEKHLGRYLKPAETVHHLNKIRNDNRIENLLLFSTPGEHSAYHNKQRYDYLKLTIKDNPRKTLRINTAKIIILCPLCNKQNISTHINGVSICKNCKHEDTVDKFTKQNPNWINGQP